MTHAPASSVMLTECFARDGLQPERYVPVADKRRMLAMAAAAGFRRIELTSFVRPDLWPQFSDADELLATYDRQPGVEYAILAPNLKGLDRALKVAAGERRFDSVTVIVAVSEEYNQKNVGRSVRESLGEMARVIARAKEADLRVTACAGTAWGCPISGPTPIADVLRIATDMREFGADRVMLGDTTGEANPATVAALVGEVAILGLPVLAHFHDSRGTALANAFAAIGAGARYLDCALGGIGGHPPEEGVQSASAGNLCTEDLVAALEGAGIRTNVDLDMVFAAGRAAEQVLGRPLQSSVVRAGLPVTLARPIWLA